MAKWLFWLAWAVVYLGFIEPWNWAHLAKALRSPSYLAALIGGLLPFTAPWLLGRMRSSLGSWPKVAAAFVPAIALGLLVYFVADKLYYAGRVYPFHPFLQAQPPSFDSYPKEKPPATFRILALGGSTTRDARLPEAARYPKVLERILQERFPSVRIEVINGGMDWYTSEHAAILYAFWARDWTPDLVVFFEGINDLYRSCSPRSYAVGPFRRDYAHFYGPVIRPYHTPSFESAIVGPFVRRWYRSLRAKARPTPMPVEYFESIATHERNVRTLVRLVRAEGTKLILGTQASLYRPDLSAEELKSLWFGENFCLAEGRYPDHESLGAAMAKVNEGLRRIALEESVPLADNDRAVPKTGEYFSDDVHSKKPGAQVVAETIAAAILGAGYLSEFTAKK